ncbi:hypothetical protein QZH41_020663, partial [Actinostola sp. cb2023]
MMAIAAQNDLQRETGKLPKLTFSRCSKELSCIQVNIESVDEDHPSFLFDDDDGNDDVYKDGICFSSPSSSTTHSRRPELLYPPVPTLTAVKERLPVFFNYKYSTIFVSGYEAERQRLEKREFGKDTAALLAERRSSYNKKRRDLEIEELVKI